MTPTKTLRERMTEALSPWFLDESSNELPERTLTREKNLEIAVNDAIRAIGDPCLIKTADSLEPTFTLRAQDRLSDSLVDTWARKAEEHGCPASKVKEASDCAIDMQFWPTRKWPD